MSPASATSTASVLTASITFGSETCWRVTTASSDGPCTLGAPWNMPTYSSASCETAWSTDLALKLSTSRARSRFTVADTLAAATAGSAAGAGFLQPASETLSATAQAAASSLDVVMCGPP